MKFTHFGGQLQIQHPPKLEVAWLKVRGQACVRTLLWFLWSLYSGPRGISPPADKLAGLHVTTLTDKALGWILI